VWLLLAALLVATLVSYYPAWHGGPLWDDDRHITRSDLRSWSGLSRIWFDLGATQQYYPLTHSAFWLQHKLWGDNTLGYHLVNIILHALSAFLVASILRRLAVPGAGLAAVIFALHPVHVESVAWITELKNVLSGVLYLGAALFYLRFDESRRKPHFGLALGLFVLALLSKTVTASLPAALLVAFWWQRGRLEWRRDVRPLVSWFVLGGAAGLLTAWLERTMVGAQGAAYQFTLIERCLIAGRVIWFYLGKLFWPADLIFIYPRWQVSRGIWWQYLYPLGLIALFFVLWRLRKHSRSPLAALLYFCGTLLPALGFFNVYPFRYSFVADHFQYLASIALIALFSACLVKLVSLVKSWRSLPRLATGMLMLLFGSMLVFPTWSQCRQYVDGMTLYRTILSRNSTCWMAHNNLGNALQGQGRIEEAIAEYNAALKLKPDYAEAYNNLGDALQKQGRIEEAVLSYREAVRLAPDLAGAYYNLGNALGKQGRIEEAAAQYEETLRREPYFAEAQCNLGVILDRIGRLEEAAERFRKAVRLKPDYVTAWTNLGNTCQRMGLFEEAAAHYREALQLEPESAEARNALGNALQRMGRYEEAVTQHEQALRLKPDSPEAHGNLGNALLGLGRVEEAFAQYREALRLRPDFAGVYFNLGNAFLKMGQLEDAITQYKEALRLQPDFAEAHHNLGLVFQRLGRYADAVTEYAEILRHAPGSAQLHNDLGAALAVLGRLEDAAMHFKEAMRLEPDFADARNNLARALSLLKK
jgi:tetratricopeptide (TPR) repeat protein